MDTTHTPVTVQKLTIVISTGCGPCMATKRALEGRGIEFDEIPGADADELSAAARAAGLPVRAPLTFTPDGRVWQGFRPDLIATLS